MDTFISQFSLEYIYIYKMEYPKNHIELRNILRTKTNVIVGHKSKPGYTVVCLKKFNRILEITDNYVRVQAGLTIRDLHKYLISRGKTLLNLGRTDVSIGAAIVRGVHGTGSLVNLVPGRSRRETIADQVESMMYLDHEGELPTLVV